MQTAPPVLIVVYDIRSRDVPKEESEAEVERTKVRRDEFRTKLLRTHKEHAELSESAYAIETFAAPVAVATALFSAVEEQDVYHVLTVKRPWHGSAPPTAKAWLEKRLP